MEQQRIVPDGAAQAVEQQGRADPDNPGRTSADRAPGSRGLAEGVGVDLAGGQPLERGEYTHSTETDLELARVPPGIDDQGAPGVAPVPSARGGRAGGELSIEGAGEDAAQGHLDAGTVGEGHPNGGTSAEGHPQ